MVLCLQPKHIVHDAPRVAIHLLFDNAQEIGKPKSCWSQILKTGVGVGIAGGGSVIAGAHDDDYAERFYARTSQPQVCTFLPPLSHFYLLRAGLMVQPFCRCWP